jgi:hypothetical protein
MPRQYEYVMIVHARMSVNKILIYMPHVVRDSGYSLGRGREVIVLPRMLAIRVTLDKCL